MSSCRVRWYSSFKKAKDRRGKGVLDVIRKSDVRSMKILSRETPKGVYEYCILQSHVDVCDLVMTMSPSMRYFNERVDECQLQKPRFDIDISSSTGLLEGFATKEILGDYVKDCVIEGILREIPTATLENNILVYSSHGPEKVSYHILVNGYVHTDNDNARGFYLKVVPDNLKRYVDASIYDKNHCLRVFMCHKRTSNRVKLFNDTFTYKGKTVDHISKTMSFKTPTHKLYYMFALSLVTYTSSSTILPSFEVPILRIHNITDISDDRVNLVREVVNGTNKINPSNYVLGEVNGGIIRLTRLNEDYCTMCEKEHDPGTMPYLFIRGNAVFWSCGRTKQYKGKSEMIFLGAIAPNLTEMLRITDKMCGDDQEDKETESISTLLKSLSDNPSSMIIKNETRIVTEAVPQETITVIPHDAANRSDVLIFRRKALASMNM